MVAKLGNIVGEHVKFDMFADNVGQFGRTLRVHSSDKWMEGNETKCHWASNSSQIKQES